MLFVLMIVAGVTIEPGWHVNLSEHDLYRARTLAVAPSGTVVTIDRDAANLMLLDNEGKLIKRVGVNGQGPGELNAPLEVTWSAVDNAFLVMDFGNSRFSWWTKDGAFVKEKPFSGQLFMPRVKDVDGAFCVVDVGAMNSGSASVVYYDYAARETKTIWRYTPPTREFTNAGSTDRPLRILFRWDPQLVFDAGSDFLALGYGDQRQFQLVDMKGKIFRTVPVEIERYHVSDAQIEEGFGHLPATLHGGMRRGLIRPEAWPYLRALHVDPKDRIWVFGGSPDLGKPHPFRVYDKSGKLLGKGRVPAVPLDVSDRGIYYLNKDSEAEQWMGVVWYRFTS